MRLIIICANYSRNKELKSTTFLDSICISVVTNLELLQCRIDF